MNPHLYVIFDQQIPSLDEHSELQNFDLIIGVSDNITATCFADGSRPYTELIWLIDGKVVNSSRAIFTVIPHKSTFDSKSELSILPNKLSGNITCTTAKGLALTFSYYVYGKMNCHISRGNVLSFKSIYQLL